MAVSPTDRNDQSGVSPDNLEVPVPWNLEVFVAQLAQRRGRRIYLSPLDPAMGVHTPCGVWIATDDADHIFYEAKTSGLHRDHIVCHELAHMIYQHEDIAQPMPDEYAQCLLPLLDPAVIRRTLGRTSYAIPAEQEAELLATRIMANTTRAAVPLAGPSSSAEVSAGLERLDETLGGL